jgi:bacteriocin-like protein
MIELNEKELKNVEGGLGALFWLIVGIAISECLDRDSPSDFWEGYNDARN